MLKKEYEVLLQFVKEPWKKFTFKEVKAFTGKKSESYIYASLKKFVKAGILKEEKAGNVVLYELGLKSQKAQVYAGFISEYVAWGQKHLPHKDLQKIADKLSTEFYIFIITGSYAKNKQKETSDIDLAIIIGDSEEPKKVYAQLRLACELNISQIHLYVFKKSEFLQMLLNNEANYGKEIAKNNLILHGGEIYYRILQEAIEYGFNDKKLY
ncbi:MAG: nucleotidyltransferase domain-containing protein [Nanoarchaeota archaeon]|nr:nucleotidyltransferase domain-containing protein [Nanoarchaeota archaeon]MBU4300172.1 nucleotidyltransferase domain-containing protein [Nanoarchaeota archaeon]MBU4451255.1 nucleotidyltransferase domain-containing protein [Nanoarchaeota archaeon]MCG2724377.1 nucleotidyltransferase domain-containing protein [archaeon]